ncbi:hypothetical protein AAHA92_14107 [Salvia divinorum]|uniref:Myb/SANT-like domain-containing protein n=1 Tax=Salvia divinorum TaxID=28513 RepID=A0ABD1HD39_SALDI
MDTMLLSNVLKLSKGWRSNEVTVGKTVLVEVCKVINDHFRSELTCGDLAIRLELLKVRYNTFKEVVATPGVQWDLDEKMILADDSTWKFIFQTNPFSRAYYHRDEPQFNLIAAMFGFDHVKIENSHEVITISDTTEHIVITDSTVPNAPYNGIHMASPADPDEVNSPLTDPSTRVRRKLFDEAETNADQLSTSVSPNGNIINSGVLGNKVPHHLFQIKELYSSPKGSSSASWSPFSKSEKTTP